MSTGRHKLVQDFYHFVPWRLPMPGLAPVTAQLSIYLHPLSCLNGLSMRGGPCVACSHHRFSTDLERCNPLLPQQSAKGTISSVSLAFSVTLTTLSFHKLHLTNTPVVCTKYLICLLLEFN